MNGVESRKVVGSQVHFMAANLRHTDALVV
jgi:hypothetical protein